VRKALVLASMTLLAVVLFGPVPVALAQRSCHYFEFAKGTNINSTLRWWYTDEYGRCNRSLEWRAGSGENTNACDAVTPNDPDGGWLPNGWYDLQGHWNDYAGASIRGRVWWMQDKRCSDGTLRTELFIHTEETSANGQDCSSAADDPWCWDSTAAYSGAGAGTNDFYSQGCIKVRRQSPEGSWPDAMSDVHSTWHNRGGGSAHGTFARTDTVYVHS
jgi:hypothetical protein